MAEQDVLKGPIQGPREHRLPKKDLDQGQEDPCPQPRQKAAPTRLWHQNKGWFQLDAFSMIINNLLKIKFALILKEKKGNFLLHACSNTHAVKPTNNLII